MLTLTLLSMLLLGTFIGVSIYLWGIPDSYSALASKWSEKLPINHLHFWSIITIAAAFFLMPVMIDQADENVLQVLGFFAPLYLMVVGCTPTWESNRKEHIIHTVGAAICAGCALAWLVLIRELIAVVVISAALMTILAIRTKSGKCYTFWLEMVMFVSVYVATFINA